MLVEVIYASNARSWVRRQIDLPDGGTVATLLNASGLLNEHPEIDFLQGYGLAIYGAAVDQSRVLVRGDRLEILRPLKVDPKEARHARARKRVTDGSRAPD